MTNTVFFSWQADTETRGGRNFIEIALKRATARISKNTEVEEAVRELAVDRDTAGVAGSPPIVDTIFRKIDQAAVFVPDLTFIGKRLNDRPTPNPNVLVEYGWALKSIGHGRIVPVMNTAYGEPIADAMPFNMRHLRNPIAYHCPADLDDDTRTQVRERLAKELESAIRAVLDSDAFKNRLPKPPGPAPFIELQPVDGCGRFVAADAPVGLSFNFPRAPEKVRVADGPLIWFRLMPTIDPGKTWTVGEIERAMKAPVLSPLSQGWAGFNFVRGVDGHGVYAILGGEPEIARVIVYAFARGEIWSSDSFWLEANSRDGQRRMPDTEASYRQALVSYGQFLQKLGVAPPYKWIAGMENLNGRLLYIPAPPKHSRFQFGPDGECLVDVVSETGLYSPGDPPGPTLKPFFSKLYESCAASRQDWQDA